MCSTDGSKSPQKTWRGAAISSTDGVGITGQPFAKMKMNFNISSYVEVNSKQIRDSNPNLQEKVKKAVINLGCVENFY